MNPTKMRHQRRRILRSLPETPCIGQVKHHWDTEDAYLLSRLRDPSLERFPLRECLRCHVTSPNPDYRRPRRREEWKP